MRQQQSTVNFMYIKTTLEMSRAIMLLHHENHWVYVFPASLHLHHRRTSASTHAFLYISFSSHRRLHQSTMAWSHVIPSSYHLLFLNYSIPSPHLHSEITSLLLNHSFYIFSSPSLSLHLLSTAIDPWLRLLSSSSPSSPSSSPSQSRRCSICMCWMRRTL